MEAIHATMNSISIMLGNRNSCSRHADRGDHVEANNACVGDTTQRDRATGQAALAGVGRTTGCATLGTLEGSHKPLTLGCAVRKDTDVHLIRPPTLGRIGNRLVGRSDNLTLASRQVVLSRIHLHLFNAGFLSCGSSEAASDGESCDGHRPG